MDDRKMPADFQSLPSPARALKQDVLEPGRSLGQPREVRRNLKLPAVALFDDGSACSVTVLDLSYDGCKIELALALLPGVQFTLSVLGLGKMPANVRWYRNGCAGLSFRPEPIEPAIETPRLQERTSLIARILLRRSGRKSYYVQTVNLSSSGCRVDFVDRPSVGERHWVKFEGMDALEGEVRWVEGFSAGLEFIRPIYPAVFELLLVKLCQ